MDILKTIESLGADKAVRIKVSGIPFEPSLIDICKLNGCGNYGKNYTCPPHVGRTEELIEKAKKYEWIIVFQKIYIIEDSFDIEGMMEGNRAFKTLVETVAEAAKNHFDKPLILGAGGCKICPECGVVTGIACRHPDKAYASLESYAIQVSALAQACGMNYINGVNTTTYFGGVLYGSN